MFTCSLCGKDWPEQYCPECQRTIKDAEEIDLPIIDSDIVNDSFSTCSAKIKLNWLRYLWFREETNLVMKVLAALVGAMLFAAAMRWWILGAVLLVLTLPVGYLVVRIARGMSVIYFNAALTAGIVVREKPLEFISMANMSTGYGKIAYGVKRVALRKLPCHPSVVGTQFPCVSGFQDGPTAELWGDFDPQPLSLGTSNLKVIAAREDKLGNEAFSEIRIVFERELYPRKADELIWLDETRSSQIPPPLAGS